jgi:hypothetical protein
MGRRRKYPEEFRRNAAKRPSAADQVLLTPHALVHVGLLGSEAQNVNDVRQF